MVKSTKKAKKAKKICSLQLIAAKNIKFLRGKMDVSQEVLADMIGCHRTYVGSVERSERNITLSTLEAFAKILKVHPSELLKD
ncbi:MAG: helix-turn-helix transcriptional regulator [Emcibacter sp.]|nr:helix-turn-helix transcriptional regulator [Emcibacter sp.]